MRVAFSKVFFNIDRLHFYPDCLNSRKFFTKKPCVCITRKVLMNLIDKLTSACNGKLGLCVGLDPDMDRMPKSFRSSVQPIYEFNKAIIDATAEFTAAYKPNLAFYINHGADGWIQLEKTIRAVPRDKVVIVDAKLGDIGNTSTTYYKAVFAGLKADMVTANPYLGSDSLSPFVQNPDKGIFILALTSNPGSSDLQELKLDGKPLFIHVILLARKLNNSRNIGLVVGGTKPSLLSSILEAAIDLPLLIPGIGAQGGDLLALKDSLKNYNAPVLVNASRSIAYASSGNDFQEAARKAAENLAAELNN